VKQAEFRKAAAEGRARPVGRSGIDIRPRLNDDDPRRAAAIGLCQARLNAWVALPRDADDKAVDKARAALQEALGILGGVTNRRHEVSPFVGRQPTVNPAAGVVGLLSR